jgi:hypothetical protein
MKYKGFKIKSMKINDRTVDMVDRWDFDIQPQQQISNNPKDLLIHTSDKKVDILIPQKILGYENKPCICFSLNQFISFFGGYVYLFEKSVLEKNFEIKIFLSGGVECITSVGYQTYNYRSQDLGQEFRIYQPIDVQQYGIGIITNFNHMKGILEQKLYDEIINRETIDLDKQSKKQKE